MRKQYRFIAALVSASMIASWTQVAMADDASAQPSGTAQQVERSVTPSAKASPSPSETPSKPDTDKTDGKEDKPTQPPAQQPTQQQGFGWSKDRKHWYELNKKTGKYEMVKSKEFMDPATGKWYYATASGELARNTEVQLKSSGGKTVYYGADGTMAKGENFHGDGWYYYDPKTGAKVTGVTWLPSNGGKWVYYNVSTGKMAHGEAYLNYDRAHTGWYYFDPITGAMAHGVTLVPGKWVYYDVITGQMQYGERFLNYDRDHTGWYYFAPVTGEMDHDWAWLPGSNKWVYYDHFTGQMLHGEQLIDGYRRWLDPVTGAADKIGFQNPPQYFQVSTRNVSVPGNAPWNYASPSRLRVDSTREQAIEAMISRAYDYLGTRYIWDYALQPGVGVDCAGLVMQALYATGMDLHEYNPSNHWFDPWHSHDANNMAADSRFKHVSLEERQRGDLIFYPGHVAIYLGNDQVIEAMVPRVRIASMWTWEGGHRQPTVVARPFV